MSYDKYRDAESFIEQTQTTKRIYPAARHPDRAGLVAAIRNEDRHVIEACERAGKPDPVDAAAKCLFWSYAAAHAREYVNPTTRGPRYYSGLIGNLEKGWGGTFPGSVAKDVLNEGAGAGGSVIIPTPVESEINRLIRDASVVREYATILSLITSSISLPTENANVAGGLVAESASVGDAIASTAFASQPLVAKKYAGLVTISNELLTDEIVGLHDYLITAIAETFGIIEDRGALDGTNFTGIRVATGVNSMTSVNSIAGGGAQPTWTEMQTLVFLALQNSSRQRGRFWMHPRALLNLTGVLATTGQPIVTYTQMWDGTIAASAYGYPISTSSAISTGQATYTSSSTIYYGPPEQIIFGDVRGTTLNVDPYKLFDLYQSRLCVTRRSGVLVPIGSAFSFMKGVKA